MRNLPEQIYEGWYIFNENIQYMEVFLIEERTVHGLTTLFKFKFESINESLTFVQSFYQNICPNMTELKLFNHYRDCKNSLTQ